MAHGYLSPQDARGNVDYLGMVTNAIGSRIGKASDMARKERAYAEKIQEDNTSLAEAGVGRGHFFARALGSTFGGDKIARTRGRLARDVTPGSGIDFTKSQAQRFRAGFVDRGRYDFSADIPESPDAATPLLTGSDPGLLGGGPGIAGALGGVTQDIAGLLSPSRAIDPEVLPPMPAGSLGGGGMGINALQSGAIDVEGEEIKDVVKALNQISMIIVQSSNKTQQAVADSAMITQQGFVSLGTLQQQVAERQFAQQKQLAAGAQQFQEQMLQRQLAAAEKRDFTEDDLSGNLTPDSLAQKLSAPFGNIFGGLTDALGMGMDLLNFRRRGRISGVRARQGFSMGDRGSPATTRGLNFRNTTMSGNTLSRARINAGTAGPNVFDTANNDIRKRYVQRYGQKAGLNRFGAEALETAGVKMTKGGLLSRFLRPIFKRIPVFGGLIDFAVSLAMGEPVGRAAAKAVGATLGAALGSLIPVPGVGTIAGGILGDFAGAAIYDSISGGSGEGSAPPQLSGGGVTSGPKSGYPAIMHGTEVTMSGNSTKETRKIGLNLGEGILDAQYQNRPRFRQLQAEGLSEYFDKKPWYEKLFEGFGGLLSGLNPAANFKWPWEQPDTSDPDSKDGTGGGIPLSQMLPAAGSTTAGDYNSFLGGRPAFTSGFGLRNTGIPGASTDHQGIDIGVDAGAEVKAIQTGKVVDIYRDFGGWGDGVVIEHQDGSKNVYGHIEGGVQIGDDVKAGDRIGTIKYWPDPRYSAGRQHLHLERIESGKKVDPQSYLDNLKAEDAAEVQADMDKIKKAQDFISGSGSGTHSVEGVGTITRSTSNVRGSRSKTTMTYKDTQGNALTQEQFMQKLEGGDQAAAITPARPDQAPVLAASAQAEAGDRALASATPQLVATAAQQPQQTSSSPTTDTDFALGFGGVAGPLAGISLLSFHANA
jgi:murein DD-endopeptidase MepM/ murein hydrolase activator NlpD